MISRTLSVGFGPFIFYKRCSCYFRHCVLLSQFEGKGKSGSLEKMLLFTLVQLLEVCGRFSFW